ncbi:MAG: heparinase II/III family protein [Anaerolineales bacterium]|nr:heparinase II/III family protein [Anaerolineales bacterium]
MTQPISTLSGLTAPELQHLLVPGAAYLSELQPAQSRLDVLRAAPQAQIALAETASFLENIADIPALPYTHYRFFVHNGDRLTFEAPYFLRRSRLIAAALRLFLGEDQYKDIVQDYIWAICEESNWVLPAHEDDVIDLFSAETGFLLAEQLAVFGEKLDAEVRSRVRQEIDRRIFTPYLKFHRSLWWYNGVLNWNGVCNSSIAATFLLLEPEPGRTAQALQIALAGLATYLETAFEKDGSSTEGVSYWNYGLINFVALSEMLRARTNGAVDLLASDHMRNVAAFPAKILLSGVNFATFSDCDESVRFEPGIITRLAERTGEASLQRLLAPDTPIERIRWFPMHLRNLLWWDGQYPQPAPVEDAYLPLGGLARLTTHTAQGSSIVVALKAGHNAENHNQNDVGSFILYADGEILLTDPGRGLYTRQYFGPERYENIFANSYGHSVPRIAGQLQPEGRQYSGEFVTVELNGTTKQVEIEFGRAYAVDGLSSARRRIHVPEEGELWLHDTFTFSDLALPVEEAFVTWLNVAVDGATATIYGERNHLKMTIEAPQAVRFAVEVLTEQCRANQKPGVLKRITAQLPAAAELEFRLRFEFIPATTLPPNSSTSRSCI